MGVPTLNRSLICLLEKQLRPKSTQEMQTMVCKEECLVKT